MIKTIGAAVLNDFGQLLPYTVRSTEQQCEDAAGQLFPAWKKMKELGCKVVQVEIIYREDEDVG